MKKKLIIAGGTGFLGAALEKFFSDKKWQVLILTRTPRAINHIHWDGKNSGPWAAELERAELLINLCGRSVDCRYNPKNKKDILDSRITPTRLLNCELSKLKHPPKIFLNASSATIYVHSEDQPMTEATGVKGNDFSMTVVKQWESAFFEREIAGMRKVALRTSIVLGEGGGAWPKLKMITRLGLGGKQGTGLQKVSWINIEDFCRAVHHIVETKYLEGPINITGPTPIANKKFMAAVREKIKPYLHISQPIWLLELGSVLMRTETELLLKSRYVLPERLIKSGFTFNHNKI